MVSIPRFLLIVPLCLIAASTFAQSAAVPQASNKAAVATDKIGYMTPELLAQDQRLSIPVQGVHSRVYLAELMQEWSKQTGVTFEARDVTGDDSGRYRIFYGLRKPLSVGEAMNALRSVLSVQGATWEWQRTGTAPNFTYRLVRPLSIDQFNAGLKNEVIADYELQLEESKRALAAYPNVPTSGVTDAGRLVQIDSDIRMGLNLFLSALSPEQQKDVLHGKDIELNIADMGAQGQQFAAVHPSGTGETQKIQFRTLWNELKPTPSLFITVNGAGNSYIGGVPAAKRWRDKLAKVTLLSTDSPAPSTTSLLAETIVPPKAGEVPLETNLLSLEQAGKHGLEDTLSQFVVASTPQTNFLTYLPQRRFISSEIQVYDRPLGNFLVKGLGEMSVASKWQKDVLLLHYTAGFASGDSVADAPPYALYAFARDNQDGFAQTKKVPLVDLATMTKLGSKDQVKTLGDEYPTVLAYLKSDTLLAQYDLFAQIATQPRAEEFESESGMRLTDLRPGLRAMLPVPEGTPRAARVVFRQGEKDGTVHAALSLQLPETGSALVPLVNFTYPTPLERAVFIKRKREQKP